MKNNYRNPMVEIIEIGYDEIKTLLTESTDGDSNRPIDFNDIINGNYRQ